jgi:hypothetical protein
MEHRSLKNVSNSLIINIYSYLETSGSQSSNLYVNAVHFFNISVNKTSVDTDVKTVVFLHCCLICVVLLRGQAAKTVAKEAF